MDPVEPSLDPLPYHTALRDYLKAQERDLWNWFASAQAQANYTESLRLELLKTTYRLDARSHPDLQQAIDEAAARLGLALPITAYQSQHTPQLNAALYYIPGEAHLVFSGPALSLLNPLELRAVVGHELAHYHLWQYDGGELHIADRLLEVVANDPRAASSHGQSARRYQLYTEIFADRGSFQVTGDVQPVVAGLVKMETGLAQVSAASYLAQAEEIFETTQVKTEGFSHPETFIRARALSLWAERRDDTEEQIRAMIEGAAALEELDLLAQTQWTALTRQVLEQLLCPKWFQTSATLGHARLFFEDFRPAAAPEPIVLPAAAGADPKLREYLGYVLLDLVAADPDLEDLPLAAAFTLADQLQITSIFEKLATKELKLKPRDVKRLKEEAAARLAQAERAP